MRHLALASTRLRAAALAAALCALLSPAPALAVPTLAISGPTAVAGGAAFHLSVTASGVTDLVAYQFDIGFDPTLFRIDTVSEGGFLATAGSTFFDAGQVDNQAGTVSFVIASLIGPGAGVNGSGTLVTLGLHSLAQAAGSGSFGLLNVSAYDTALNPLGVALQDHVVSVPEPATWAMALAGLAIVGAGSLRRARRAATAA